MLFESMFESNSIDAEIIREDISIKKTKAIFGSKYIMFKGDETIKRGDIIKNLITEQKFKVINPNPISLPEGIHHYETKYEEID